MRQPEPARSAYNAVMNSLDGIRILDLSRVLAGPWCTQNLGDLGADVLKVERPGAGDDTRTWGPPYLKTPQGQDTSEAAYYLGANRNKRSITCDISQPQGQELIRELVRHCDVFIENFKVGDMVTLTARAKIVNLNSSSSENHNSSAVEFQIMKLGISEEAETMGEAITDALEDAEDE